MKIKNEYVKINTNSNIYTLKNTILDKYLERLATSQVRGVGKGYAPVLNTCYLKFDTKLIFDESTELFTRHFNKKLTGQIIEQEINEDIISTTYKYNSSNLSNYLDKEITAIGFFEGDEEECLACLNLYGLGLTITDFTNFYIERKDTIKSGLTFIKNYRGHIASVNDIIHLIPDGNKVNGTTVDIFLENIYEGDRNGGYITPQTFSIDENELENGIIKIDSGLSNEYQPGLLVPGETSCPNSSIVPTDIGWQCNYIFLEYCPYDHETGTRMWNGGYYVRFPIDIVNDYYKILLKFERSEE